MTKLPGVNAIHLARLLAVVLPLTGCAGPASTSFIQKTVDFSRIQRCAVIPYENLTPDAFADDRLQSIFLLEILRDGSLQVIDPEETVSAMRELKLVPGAALTPEQMVALGKALEVEGVFFGTVDEYGLARGSRREIYAVTASFGMAETETGGTIWRSQVHADGSSFWKKLFGGGSASLYDVSRKAVRSALGSLL